MELYLLFFGHISTYRSIQTNFGTNWKFAYINNYLWCQCFEWRHVGGMYIFLFQKIMLFFRKQHHSYSKLIYWTGSSIHELFQFLMYRSGSWWFWPWTKHCFFLIWWNIQLLGLHVCLLWFFKANKHSEMLPCMFFDWKYWNIARSMLCVFDKFLAWHVHKDLTGVFCVLQCRFCFWQLPYHVCIHTFYQNTFTFLHAQVWSPNWSAWIMWIFAKSELAFLVRTTNSDQRDQNHSDETNIFTRLSSNLRRVIIMANDIHS